MHTWKPCDFEQIAETQWQCRRCGRMVVSAKRADGTLIAPPFEQLSPCGWKGFHVEIDNHYWMEAYQPDGQRHWQCGRCQQNVSLPGQTTNEEAKIRLARQSPCPAQKPPATPALPSASTETPPGLAQRAWNYTQAMARWLVAGRPTRSPEEIERLLAICRTCSHYDAKAEICRVCGCRATTAKEAWRNKLAMATEACPLKKWGAGLSPESSFESSGESNGEPATQLRNPIRLPGSKSAEFLG